MLNIIKSDLYRLFRGKAIYIVSAIIIFLSIISIITLSPGHVGLSTGSSNLSLDNAELLAKISTANSLKEFRDILKSVGTFALDKEVVGQNVNLYYAFIVVVVIVITVDFSNKSIKNTLSSAISRRKYYFSKLLLILGICTFFVLLNNYFTYFLNLAVNGKEFASSFMEITKLTIYQIPLIYGIISLLVCFAFSFRKTSTFNTISIPFIMVFQLVVGGIITLFRLKADIFYNYEIQYALSNLANSPTNSYIIKCMILGIIYTLVFNFIGYNLFKKAEIK